MHNNIWSESTIRGFSRLDYLSIIPTVKAKYLYIVIGLFQVLLICVWNYSMNGKDTIWYWKNDKSFFLIFITIRVASVVRIRIFVYCSGVTRNNERPMKGISIILVRSLDIKIHENTIDYHSPNWLNQTNKKGAFI